MPWGDDLPKGDRNPEEQLPPPRPGESRAEWVERLAREQFGVEEPAPAPAPRPTKSAQERIDEIFAGEEG